MDKVISSGSNNVKKKSQAQLKDEFDNIVAQYLESSNNSSSDNLQVNELEVRFGTNYKARENQPITKINYDNVVQMLYSHGFSTDNIHGSQILRIQNVNTRQHRTSNIRTEILGSELIQEYCKTNDLNKVINMPSTIASKVKFTNKMPALNKSNEPINMLMMPDYNFNLSYQTEQDIHINSPDTRDILLSWNDSLKTFRAMNRVKFTHKEYPIIADISVVRSSKKIKGIPVKSYTIQEAEVFNNIEHYEIELEVDNSKIGQNTDYDTVNKITSVLRKCIRIILCGLQNTNYPISFSEQETIISSYMKLLHGNEYTSTNIEPSNFIGPSSYTLQMSNIIKDTTDSKVPNIRKNYTVTDKADGDRKLMYISNNGKIYLIDTNMKVTLTGVKTNNKTHYNSLLDGEHIKYGKTGKIINIYGAFDIYINNSKNVMGLAFANTINEILEEGEEGELKTNDIPVEYRLDILSNFINTLSPYSIFETTVNDAPKNKNMKLLPLNIKCKEFGISRENDEISIFNRCAKILLNERDGLYEYNTDGIIFTPANLPVGGSSMETGHGPLHKSTWEYSFKWKPANYNTIDFLVSIKKDKTGKDEIHNIFTEGKNLQDSQNVQQYKTIILRCGFDENKHGYLNPFNDLIHDKIKYTNDLDNKNTYKPVEFYPTNPADPDAAICNIKLTDTGTSHIMLTEEGEYFEEHTIVEFKYIPSNEPGWRWIPLRVRYDKTTELRNGIKNYGNAYHVANTNWQSIHNPITEHMISTGLDIPEYIIDDDVYYNRSKMETSTRSLRDFHNLFIKSKLIQSVSSRGDTLIDYAVGQGGDLSKWIHAKLKFVFGIDVFIDNIVNQTRGACSRYLNALQKHKKIPNAMFLHGDSSRNIRNGDAYESDQHKRISNALFGKGSKDVSLLGKGVYKNYGIGEQGFNISSCQFAMHYFFKDKPTLHGFLRNITECTKLNGYYIGTCFDGKTVFNSLKNKKKGEGIVIYNEKHKIFELIKQYDQTGFPDDENSIGYAIDVYQETINKTFREFLVNFDYLIKIMEDYGFVLLTKEEALQINLPNGSGLFNELFNDLENELKISPQNTPRYRTSLSMTPEEKRISFLNRYFVFRKVRDVNVDKLAENIDKQTNLEAINETLELSPDNPIKFKIKKTGKKIVLKK